MIKLLQQPIGFIQKKCFNCVYLYLCETKVVCIPPTFITNLLVF